MMLINSALWTTSRSGRASSLEGINAAWQLSLPGGSCRTSGSERPIRQPNGSEDLCEEKNGGPRRFRASASWSQQIDAGQGIQIPKADRIGSKVSISRAGHDHDLAAQVVRHLSRKAAVRFPPDPGPLPGLGESYPTSLARSSERCA